MEGRDKHPTARRRDYSLAPVDQCPSFDARIFINEGGWGSDLKGASSTVTGVRVFLEGFRVLPYGEAGDDWLEINANYIKRTRRLNLEGVDDNPIEDEALSRPRGDQILGGVFLTEEAAEGLQMLVNREGFVPNGAFYGLQSIVAQAVELSTRVRAAASLGSRRRRSAARAGHPKRAEIPPPSPRAALLRALGTLSTSLDAVMEASSGETAAVRRHLKQAKQELEAAHDAAGELVSVDSMTRILASVGTQMAGFVHELNTLVSMTNDLEDAITRLRERDEEPTRADIGEIQGLLHHLRRYLLRASGVIPRRGRVRGCAASPVAPTACCAF